MTRRASSRNVVLRRVFDDLSLICTYGNAGLSIRRSFDVS